MNKDQEDNVSELLSTAGYQLNNGNWLASIAHSNLAIARMAWYGRDQETVDYDEVRDTEDNVVKVVPEPVDWGHGHVYPRKDGALARCGGPTLCSKCAIDKVRLDQEMERAKK